VLTTAAAQEVSERLEVVVSRVPRLGQRNARPAVRSFGQPDRRTFDPDFVRADLRLALAAAVVGAARETRCIASERRTLTARVDGTIAFLVGDRPN
jgi:hypothetical protein